MNFQLYNDKVWTLPLKCQNAAGVQTFPAGSNPLAVSSNPASLGATVIVTSGLAVPQLFGLVLTPKVQVSPGLTVTVTNVGMAPVTFPVDIVADPNLLSVIVDIVPADVTSAAQSIPVAPGP